MNLLPSLIVDIVRYFANVVTVGGFLLLIWSIGYGVWMVIRGLWKARRFPDQGMKMAHVTFALEFLVIAMVIRTFLQPAGMEIAELLALVGVWLAFSWRKGRMVESP